MENLSAIWTDDPLTGDINSISFNALDFNGSDAISVPKFLRNWGFFKGALLAICLKDEEKSCVIGTGFLVAPGLAITATHIFNDHLDRITAGIVAPFAMSINEDAPMFWKILQFSHTPDDDITIASVAAASALPAAGKYYQFPITTRQPGPDESIHLIGFRGGVVVDAVEPHLGMDLLISAGNVGEVYPNGRDSSLLPYPAFEVKSGSMGGMSGGIAIDSTGHVLGVISRGLSHDDNMGPTYVSWIVKCLLRKVPSAWPKGLINGDITLLEISPSLAFIERPDAVSLGGDGNVKYAPWHNSSAI